MKKIKKYLYITVIMIIISFQMCETKANGYFDTFVQTSDGWNYYNSDGKKVSNSWVYKDGTYFINEEGRITYGSLNIDGKEYIFDETGKLKNDWIVYKNNKYEMASGSIIKNKEFINGKQHFFYNEKGNVVQGLQKINGNLYYLTSTGIAKEGFMTVEGRERYVFVGGRVAINQFVSNDQKKYYVNDNGTKLVGLQTINNETYCFDNAGAMQFGTLLVNNTWRYFGEDGAMKSNEFFQLSNKTYYAKENGSLSYGLVNIDSKMYYFNSTGEMQKGTLLVNNTWCHFGEDGAMKREEWFALKDKQYYAKANGSLSYGLVNIDSKVYYFDSTGAMQKGTLLVNNAWRHFGEDGAMKREEWFTVKDKQHYAKANGSFSYGLVNIDSKMYYFDSTGAMQRGTLLVNNAWRYFDENGVMKNNEWFKIIDDTYYAKEGGSISYGSIILKGIKHKFDAMGRLIENPDHPMSGWTQDKYGYKLLEFGEFLKNEFRTIQGKRYYIKPDGYRAIGLTNYQNSYFYFDEKGVMQCDKFINVGGWRYFNFGGIMPTNMWIYFEDKVYHANKNGFIEYGERVIENEIYFFDNQGAKYEGLAVGHNGNEYYFKYNGGIAKNEFVIDNNKKYFMNKSGSKAKGAQIIEGKEYFFDNSNGIMITGFIQDASKRTFYYLENGGKAKGFFDLGTNTYFFELSNGVMALGYKTIDRRNFHFDEISGILLEVSANLNYYNQKDDRWGDKMYGSWKFSSTGCVPTSAAMVFSFLLNNNLLPYEIGNWAYDQGYFNNYVSGTRGTFWSNYAKLKGVSIKGDLTVDEAITSLKHGGIIVAAMNPGVFTRPGSTHEIVIFGIDQYNRVNVYDPYFTEQNGKYDINLIFNQKSSDSEDCIGGGPIFSLGV